MDDIIFIGIAGGSGSGKTTITKNIVEELGRHVTVINHDMYYKEQHDKPFEERVKVNYDHPDAFETELMIKHILKLKAGESVEAPVYDFSIHDRSDKTVTLEPSRVVIIDGILIFSYPELRDLMDIKIYVDTDADVRIIRRILRDVNERGRKLDNIVAQYLTTVKPMHEAFVEPSKKYADVIIPEGGFNKVALEMILERIKSHLLKVN